MKETEGDGSVNQDLTCEKEIRTTDTPCLCSQRWILAYLGFLFGAIFGLYRINMSMAVVCMVKGDTDIAAENSKIYNVTGVVGTNRTYSVGENGSNVTLLDTSVTTSDLCQHDAVRKTTQNQNAEFEWDRQTQSTVLSAFFYGFVTSQIPSGWIIGRFGGKIVITVCTAASSLFTLLIPWLARRHVAGVICARVLVGIMSGPLMPAWFALVGKWALSNERSRIMMLYWTGIAGLLFVVLWVCLAADSPNKHPRITLAEKELIAKHLKVSKGTSEKVDRVPWLSMLSSVAVWSIFITQLCHDWLYYLILACLPMFVNEVLKFDIQSNGFYSSLPFITTTLSLLCSGILADYVNKKRWHVATLPTRETLVGSATFLVMSSYLPCDRRSLVILCMCVCTFFLYIALSAGYPCNVVDMSPRYASYLYGISNTIGATTGFLSPLAVGILTKHKTIQEWQFVFWVSAGIAAFGAVTHGMFSSSELLPWDSTYDKSLEIEITGGEKDCVEINNTQGGVRSKTMQPLLQIQSKDQGQLC